MGRQLQAIEVKRPTPAWLVWVCCGLSALILAAGAGWFALRGSPSVADARRFNVSQRGREFRPGLLEISRGDVVDIINDDGEISHHAYIAGPTFSFDSGDQEPGGNVAIAFTVDGTFSVLCGIHPKMRLTVVVK